MKRERYSIIYSSKTGNTKKLAEAIYNTLPQNKCDYYGTVDKIDDVLSNVIYIGFWTEKGNADHLTIDFLNKLKNKKIFLFGTAGYGERYAGEWRKGKYNGSGTLYLNDGSKITAIWQDGEVFKGQKYNADGTTEELTKISESEGTNETEF